MHSFLFVLQVRGPTKYHIYRKRAYFGTSTAVPYVVYGVRYRPYSCKITYHSYTLRILVSHDSGSVSRPHSSLVPGMRVPVLQNEDSSCNRLYVRECNASNTAYSKYFGCLHCCCCGYCLCSGPCNHMPGTGIPA